MADIDKTEWGRLLQMVDDMSQDVIETKVEIARGFKSMNGRVRKLENWRNVVVGALGVLGWTIYFVFGKG